MTMERMSDKELKQLRELQAKQKRVQRADAEFFKNIDERRDEVIEHLQIADRLSDAAKLYDTDVDTLYQWLIADKQINAFRQNRNAKEISDDSGIIEETIEEESGDSGNSIGETIDDVGDSLFY